MTFCAASLLTHSTAINRSPASALPRASVAVLHPSGYHLVIAFLQLLLDLRGTLVSDQLPMSPLQ
jgi:hypothetical protein